MNISKLILDKIALGKTRERERQSLPKIICIVGHWNRIVNSFMSFLALFVSNFLAEGLRSIQLELANLHFCLNRLLGGITFFFSSTTDWIENSRLPDQFLIFKFRRLIIFLPTSFVCSVGKR